MKVVVLVTKHRTSMSERKKKEALSFSMKMHLMKCISEGGEIPLIANSREAR